MKNLIITCLLFVCSLANAGLLNLKDGDIVAFVGGTFVEREAEYSLIETYLTLANSDKNIKFRNLGWSADTVKGESRGYFKPQEGYRLLLQKVEEAKPTVIILTYGANASWNGSDGLASFIKDYSKLIKDLQEKTSARIVLMSTPRQENLGAPYPNPDKHNNDQTTYFAAIKQLAKQSKIPFVDLFNDVQDVKGLTSNSIHLTARGYEAVAQKLSPLATSPKSSLIIDATNSVGMASSGELENVSKINNGIIFSYKPEKLGRLTSTRSIKVTGLQAGKYELSANGRILLTTTAAALRAGLESSDLLVQEKLLQTEITEKNEQFFHSWRPQNTTYLFGFRKHEQGQNGKEIGQFGAFIASTNKKSKRSKNFSP